MDLKTSGINFDEIKQQRIELADRLMSIIDEDGQPMYNESWIIQNILTQEIENPE